MKKSIKYQFTCHAGTVEYISESPVKLDDVIMVKGVEFKIIMIKDSVEPNILIGYPKLLC